MVNKAYIIVRNILFFPLFLLPFILSAVTTNTTSPGNWNTAGNWTGGVPTSADDANVNHAMTINTNITTIKGDYIINSPITDIAGGTAYNLDISGTGGDPGNFDVNANATFEGTLMISSNGILTIRSGDTLVVGATTFANGSKLVIETGGVLIINGDLTNNNNSNDINVDGKIFVNGNVTGGNGSTITGGGSLEATGTITTTGDGAVFGSTDDCVPGPCGLGTPPLPITLNYFTSVNKTNFVQFYWETLSEINNDFFTIERTIDLKEFEVITVVKGSGNSRQKIEYEATDESPLPGTSYYRLRQTDYDGTYTYSDLVSNNHDSKHGGIQISPNPSRGQILLDLGDVAEKALLKLRDTQGKVVRVVHLEKTQTNLDLSNLKDGLYVIQCYNESNQLVAISRFLKY